MNENAVREGFEHFKAEKSAQVLREIARKHELELASLKTLVDGIIQRMIFNGDQLSDLPVPLDLGWKARTQKRLALMEYPIPLINDFAHGMRFLAFGLMSSKACGHYG